MKFISTQQGEGVVVVRYLWNGQEWDTVEVVSNKKWAKMITKEKDVLLEKCRMQMARRVDKETYTDFCI